MFIIPVLIIE
jgi:hypothetical protein